MSASDGVQKLVEYLAATRRQAELSISSLNQRIIELEEVYEQNISQINRLQEENDYYKNAINQLQAQSTNKSRLQERDDWKCLVESIQKDRARLQEDCLRLEMELESYKIVTEDRKDLTNTILKSNPSSPSNIERKYQAEIEYLKSELEVTKKANQAEISALTSEIAKLNGEISQYKQYESTSTRTQSQLQTRSISNVNSMHASDVSRVDQSFWLYNWFSGASNKKSHPTSISQVIRFQDKDILHV